MFESSPGHLKFITPASNETFDIVLDHEESQSVSLNVRADHGSLLKRFVGG